MNQSTKIAGCLAFAFLVFITARGELPDYLACLGIGPRAKDIPKDHPATETSGGDSGGGIDMETVANVAKVAMMFI